jgi:aryl-alcohol dehydrogenase-like predicted oxidoreductase
VAWSLRTIARVQLSRPPTGARAIGKSETLRLARIASVQPRYALLFREIECELLPLAAEEVSASFHTTHWPAAY